MSPPILTQATTITLQARLFEALKHGAIPIVLGNHAELPLSEAIDWRKLGVVLPKARIMELHYLLRSFSDADILVMRRQVWYYSIFMVVFILINPK